MPNLCFAPLVVFLIIIIFAVFHCCCAGAWTSLCARVVLRVSMMMPFFFFRLTINCEAREPFVAADRLFVFPTLTVNYSDIFSKPSRYVPLQFFAALLTSRPRVLNVTGTGELIKDEDDDDDDDDAGS